MMIKTMMSIVVMLITHYTIGVLSNVHGEGHDHNHHNHHHHDHGNHGAHHHHDESGDCELDDSLADLIKSFGLSVLGKDQESADDVQPTEDHDHINIKALVEELFHPSTTPKTTTTTTLRTTWTERLPIKSHDLGWDLSPVDLVMNNHIVQPVFDQEEEERHPRNFGATTQKPVYLTETHYYFPRDIDVNHSEDDFAPFEEDRVAKSLDLDLNLDVSQLIDKPTIPVVDTRLANFLLVNGGQRPKASKSKPKQHINDHSDKSNDLNSLDNPLRFKQPTAPPFLIKFVDPPRKNNSPSEFSRSKRPTSPPSKGQISRRIQAPSLKSEFKRPTANSVGSQHSKLVHPPLILSPSPFTTNPASNLKSTTKDSHLLHVTLAQVRTDVQLHAEKQSPNIGAHKNREAKTSTSISHQTRKKQSRKSNRHSKQNPGHRSGGQERVEFSDSGGKDNKGMVFFNGLDMVRMKEDKFECLDRKEGLHADIHSGCKRFYMCHENGRSGRFTCPVGTLFSNTLGVCNWEAKVKCGEFNS